MQELPDPSQQLSNEEVQQLREAFDEWLMDEVALHVAS